MKNLLTAVLTISSFYSFSQGTTSPVIKQGAKLNYSIATNEGALPLVIKLDSLSTSYVKFTWSAPNLGTGTWVLKESSLQKANAGYWNELEPDKVIVLPDNQTIVLFSKAQWAGIQKDKKMEFDGVAYTLKTSPASSKLAMKDASALYLENENGSSKIWVLNNPSFPAILKIEGNVAGPDAELKSVE